MEAAPDASPDALRPAHPAALSAAASPASPPDASAAPPASPFDWTSADTGPLASVTPAPPPRRRFFRRGRRPSVAGAFATQPLPARRPAKTLSLALFFALAFILMTASGALLAYADQRFLSASAPSIALPTATPTTIIPDETATPTPRPTPTVNPNQARNLAMGCVAGAPPPQLNIVETGKNILASGPPPNEVALTFDDGPTPYTTPPILDVLERTHTPATFFVLGSYTHIWPQFVQREWRDGFAIGAHSWDHPQMTKLTADQRQYQFTATMTALHAALGQDACLWFWRPPYGDVNQQVFSEAKTYGLSTIMWDDDPRDWSRPGTNVIVDRVLAAAHPGSIILMHDGPAAREQTAAALPLIIDGLKARGLTPVTLPRLLADGAYPGIVIIGSRVSMAATFPPDALAPRRRWVSLPR